MDWKRIVPFWGREPKELMKPEKLVVGLGNPGPKYKGTRHNIGFMVLAELAGRFAGLKPQNRFRAEVLEARIKEQNVLLLCPSTYMNLSGSAVAEAVRFFKLTPDQILVVCDDMDLPVSRLRLRERGGSGGQKGLKDIVQKLGTEEVPRLRVGIGRPPENRDAADYVLSTFRTDERADLAITIKQAADAIELWIEKGIVPAMNRFNP